MRCGSTVRHSLELVRWMMTTAAVAVIADGNGGGPPTNLTRSNGLSTRVVSAGEDSGYRLSEFLELVRLVGDGRATEE